jgi:prepilin-type N-terminal cleavage/methylation domain-containing protein
MEQPYLCQHSRGRQGFTIMELLFVLALFGVLAAIAVPLAKPAVGGYQIAGQAHALAYDVALAKMQAASRFTQARLYVDLASNSYRVETWNATSGAWTSDSDTVRLPSGVRLGYAGLAAPPPDTQSPIGQASVCLDATNAEIANTSCVRFNSRGVPIDATGTPTLQDAVYLTDGSVVYAVSVSLGGLTQLWWTPAGSPAWQKQ